MIYWCAYLIFAVLSWASAAEAISCDDYVLWHLRASVRNFERSLFYERQLDAGGRLPSTDASKLSVESKTVFLGPQGGRMFVAQRLPGLRWYSHHAKLGVGDIRPDLQGDPRMGIISLGLPLARVVSMEVISGRRIMLGDAEEVGQGLALFNVYLRQQGIETIPVQYANSGNQSNLIERLEAYLQNYESYTILPIEDPELSWSHFLHDLGFHTAFVMVTPELLEKHKILVRGQNLFLKFAKQKLRDLLGPRLARLAYRALLVHYSTALDVFTARLFQGGYFLLKDRTRLNRFMVPGRYVGDRGDDEEAMYRQEIRQLFGISMQALDFSSASVSSATDLYDSVNWINNHLWAGGNDRTRYFLGSAGASLDFDDLFSLRSALSLAVSEFLANAQSLTFLDLPLISSLEEIEHLAKGLKARRKVLQRAARDYWQLQGPPSFALSKNVEAPQ